MTLSIKPLELQMGNDALFKMLFRSVESRRMASRVLSKITGIDENVLMRAKFRGGEIPKKHSKEKGKTSDILIFLEDNTIII